MIYSVILFVVAVITWYQGCFKWQSAETETKVRLFSWFTFQSLGIITGIVLAIKCNYGSVCAAVANLDWAGYLEAVNYDPYLYSIIFLWCIDVVDNDSTHLKYKDGIDMLGNMLGEERVRKLVFSVSGIVTIFTIGILSY